MAKHLHERLGRTRHSAPSASRRYVASSVSAVTPDSPRAELRLGLEAFEQGDYGLATQAWNRAGQNGAPSGLAAALAEAHFRRALGAANEARQIQELSEAVQLTPDRALYHYHLGLAYFGRGQLRRAVAALETACCLEPENGRFHRHLALATLSDPLVTPDGSAVLDASSFRSEAMLSVHALAKLRKGEPTCAASALAVQAKPSALARLSLGLAYLAASRPREALGQLQELARSAAVSREAQDAAAIGGMAAHLQLGDVGAAFDELRQLSAPVGHRLRATFTGVVSRLVQELVLDERIED